MDVNELFVKYAEEGDLDNVKKLINQIDQLTLNKALQNSAAHGKFNIVKYLTENNADLHADDDAAFVLAAVNGHLDIVKYLFELKPNIHAYEDYAIKESAHNGFFDVVKYLVENGADIHKDGEYATNSTITRSGEFIAITKYLLDHGANPNKCVISASLSGNIEFFKLLASYGADFHQLENYAFDVALACGQKDITEFLNNWKNNKCFV